MKKKKTISHPAKDAILKPSSSPANVLIWVNQMVWTGQYSLNGIRQHYNKHLY